MSLAPAAPGTQDVAAVQVRAGLEIEAVQVRRYGEGLVRSVESLVKLQDGQRRLQQGIGAEEEGVDGLGGGVGGRGDAVGLGRGTH